MLADPGRRPGNKRDGFAYPPEQQGVVIMRRVLPACLILILVSSVAFAGKKPGSNSMNIDVDYGFMEPVSIFSAPDGSGYPLTRAFTFGGTEIDASITVTLTTTGGLPMSGVPAEDILLVLGGNFYHLCGEDGAVCGIGVTDGDGVMILDGPIVGGGYSDPDGTPAHIEVSTYFLGRILSAVSQSIPLYMNSPDINGDGTVNLLDVTLLAGDRDKFDRLGKYNYRSDFNWDGVIDDIDSDMLSESWSASCP